MGRPRQTMWTEETVYATIKAFVLAEHRLPSVRDYEARAHGLPSNSGIAYRACKHFKARLARDGVGYTVTPRSSRAPSHPWRRAAGVMVATRDRS